MALMKFSGTPMWRKIFQRYSRFRLGKAAEKSKRNRAPRGCLCRAYRTAWSISMMLGEMYRPDRKPRCSFRQNLLATGIRIRLRRDAMIRLSVLTTDIGRRLAGV